uniref:Uncharacterized protein n=1 Tax=Tetranychus urticae TaxID=32264 RepID=T1KMD4_TETUR
MQKNNLTIGAFSVPFARGFAEKDGQIIPRLVSLKRLQVILSQSDQFNLKFILPEEGQLGVLTETGYHDGVLGLLQEGNSSHTSSWLCLIQMLILMFPVFIFNSAFSTQTIVGTADYKIDTLKDVINQGRIPFFLEGISMHDFFKAKVTKDYAGIYERSVSEGFGEAFQLGPIPVFEKSELMVTFISSVGRKLAPLMSSVSGFAKANQEHYFSAKPFHKSLQSILFSYNISKPIRRKFDTLGLRIIQSGIVPKLEADIYIEFILSFYPTTLFEFHKSEWILSDILY